MQTIERSLPPKELLGRQIDVKYFHNLTDEEKNSIEDAVLIGLGTKDMLFRTDLIILNNKIDHFSSVTAYINQVPDDIVEEWKMKLQQMTNPIILLEDVSPDTCFSFHLFQLKINGDRSYDKQLFEVWSDYCNRWEQGDMVSTGAPFESWGALHNALSHDHFVSDEIKKMDESKFQLGFSNCMNFLTLLLENKVSPFQVPLMSNSIEYQRARALLRYEYQEYLQSLEHSETLQLELPVTNSNKTMIVDAYIAEENRNLGSQKVFLRNDKDNTWLKSGFGLMAIHNPNAVGTGNDMTISVEPTLGVNLYELWRYLEDLEDKAWGKGNRPSDDPRYKEDNRSKANQPWYDENKKCTIIGAPKKVGDELGTKLSWSEVVEALWKQYNPINHILVDSLQKNNSIKEPCLPHECVPFIKHKDKHMLAMKWSTNNQRPIVLSPTTKRYFAACANGKRDGGFPSLDELPSERAYDFMQIPGGFVVIHENGVLFFDDWSKEQCKLDLFSKEFNNAYERYEAINRIYDDIREEIDSYWEKINKSHKRISPKELIQLNNRITKLKLDLRRTLLRTIVKTSEGNAEIFREALEKRWGISRKIDDLYEAVSELESIVNSHSETQTNQLITGITIYGFPFVLFSSLLQFIFGGEFTKESVIIGIVTITVASLLVIYGIRLNLNRNSKLGRRTETKDEFKNY